MRTNLLLSVRHRVGATYERGASHMSCSVMRASHVTYSVHMSHITCLSHPCNNSSFSSCSSTCTTTVLTPGGCVSSAASNADSSIVMVRAIAVVVAVAVAVADDDVASACGSCVTTPLRLASIRCCFRRASAYTSIHVHTYIHMHMHTYIHVAQMHLSSNAHP